MGPTPQGRRDSHVERYAHSSCRLQFREKLIVMAMSLALMAAAPVL